MILAAVKTPANSRILDKKSTFESLPRKQMPSLVRNSDQKGVRIMSSKMGRFATNQICFVKKKDLFQYNAKKDSPLPEFSRNILRTTSKRKEKKNGKKSIFSADVTTKSWCLFDEQTCRTFGFRDHYKREIASLTKIVTVLLSIEFVFSFKISLNCKVKITKTAAGTQGTTASLQKNYWVSFLDLLYGAMLPSGNDAAYLLSEYIGYFMHLFNRGEKEVEFCSDLQKIDLSEHSTLKYVKQFVGCMNERISYMGLFNSQFSNPHGLQNALNVSSALDMIRLAVDASKNSLFKKIMNTIKWQCTLYQNDHFRKKIYRSWTNTNQLLQKDWEGVKTGFTNAAGGCLASMRHGIYIVVLNSSNSVTRFSDTEKIYHWYHKNRQSQGLRLHKLTQSCYIDEKKRDFKSSTALENIETDITV